jgi:hypothetical protein
MEQAQTLYCWLTSFFQTQWLEGLQSLPSCTLLASIQIWDHLEDRGNLELSSELFLRVQFFTWCVFTNMSCHLWPSPLRLTNLITTFTRAETHRKRDLQLSSGSSVPLVKFWLVFVATCISYDCYLKNVSSLYVSVCKRLYRMSQNSRDTRCLKQKAVRTIILSISNSLPTFEGRKS